VDGYAWLHKASYSCCVQLCTGKAATAWIAYVLGLVDMLLAFEVNVVMVFDGDDLPAKKGTEDQRASGRAENLKAGLDALSKGDYATARGHLSKAVDITPRMAAELIKVLREQRPGVRCLVAPYEVRQT
jgi:exonuclease-1